MSKPEKFETACFVPQDGPHRNQIIKVHFNPASLQFTVSNTLQDQNREHKQYVTKSVAKLTMDLTYDTTDTGTDVRTYTGQIAAFMHPIPDSSRSTQQVPIIVEFRWGTYHFKGIVESYRETIDFFAATGVPLRASINLTLSRQEKVFDSEPAPAIDKASSGSSAVAVPAGAGGDATKVANQGGNPRAGAALAAANGLDSMRFSNGATLTVSGGVQLRGPVAFASAGAGIGGGLSIGGGAGLSLGAGAGIGGGLSIGGGAGISASGGASFSAGAGAGLSLGGATFSASATSGMTTAIGSTTGSVALAGASLSAGVSAGGGAFAGLWSAAPTVNTSLDPNRYLAPNPSAGLATSGAAGFSVGGQALVQDSASLSADVGATASLRSRIQFQEG